MGRVQVVLEDDVEEWIRVRAKRKGDISKLINDGLREAFGLSKS